MHMSEHKNIYKYTSSPLLSHSNTCRIQSVHPSLCARTEKLFFSSSGHHICDFYLTFDYHGPAM